MRLLIRRGARGTAPSELESRWGPIGFRSLPVRHGAGPAQPVPDLRTQVPFTPMYGRARWPGLQKRNGVSQLAPLLEVPTASDLPFWQVSQLRNPSRYTRFGGSASTPITPALALQAQQAYYTGVDTTGRGVPTVLGRLSRRAR